MKSVKLCAVGVIAIAVQKHYIENNIFADVAVPKIDAMLTRTLTDDETQRVVSNPNGHRMCSAALFMLFCGLRRSEAVALKWAAVDLNKKRVFVREQIAFEANIPVLKAAAPERKIIMPDVLCSLLEKEKNREGLVCAGLDGGYCTEHAFRAAWEGYERFIYRDKSRPRVRARQEKYRKPRTLTPAMFHQTYAKQLFESGVNMLVCQELLGHTTLEMTCKLYGQLIEKNDKKDHIKLNQIFDSFSSRANITSSAGQNE